MKMKKKDQLRELYASKWDGLCKGMQPILEDGAKIQPANPLLLCPGTEKGDEYDSAKIHVMIFGQETNRWFDSGYDNSNTEIERLMNIYDGFFTDREYRSQFWNGLWLFTRMLGDQFPKKKIGYIWNNVVKIGKADKMGTPPDYIYNVEQQHFSVVKEEIEILKPHIILFLTGPNYDGRIKDKLGELTFEPLSSSYDEREIAKLTIPHVDYAVRTYQPNYLYRQGKGTIEAYFETIINMIPSHVRLFLMRNLASCLLLGSISQVVMNSIASAPVGHSL
jgi:hypothetical protein